MSYSLFFSVFFLYTSQLFGHGLAHDRLHDLHHEIQHQPNNAKLYIKQGRIYLDMGKLAQAKKSFDHAAKIKPFNIESIYWQALVLYRQKHLNDAKLKIQNYLKQAPYAPHGQKLLAEILVTSGDSLNALEHYDLAIVNDRKPSPQIFIDRYNTQLSIIPPLPKQAIESGLMQGINYQGEIINFVSLMLDYKIKTLQLEDAKMWCNKLPLKLRQSPKWINTEADILYLMDRRSEALSLYKQNIKKLSALPHAKQMQPAGRYARQRAEKLIVLINERK